MSETSILISYQEDGSLEHHVPLEYTEKRPGFIWSSETFDTTIDAHPLASRLPKAVSKPTLFPGCHIFHDLATRHDHPTKITDWTQTDHPPLSVHLVSFQDATLFTLSWSHVLLDAVGRQGLLTAWIAVLDGREHDVPHVIPLSEDPSGEIAKGAKPEDSMLYKACLTGIWFAMFVINMIVNVLLHSKTDERMICLPGPWVEDLRQRAMQETRSEASSALVPFLSHGDVLHAWLSKLTVSSQKIRRSRPVNLMNIYNIRGLFEDALPAKSVYIGNASFPTQTIMTAEELSKISMGEAALRLRNDLTQQRTVAEVKALVAFQKETVPKTGRSPLGGPWNQCMVSLSNWHKARFFDFDFSAAVIRPGKRLEDRAQKLGQPSLIFPTGHTNGLSLRNSGPLIGRDAAGNWWLQWNMRAGAWPDFEAQFEAMVGRKND